MTKLELKEWITELACSLDRGDLKIDELMNEVEEIVDKNVTEQLTLTDVVSCVCKMPEPRLKVSENGTHAYCNNCAKTYLQK